MYTYIIGPGPDLLIGKAANLHRLRLKFQGQPAWRLLLLLDGDQVERLREQFSQPASSEHLILTPEMSDFIAEQQRGQYQELALNKRQPTYRCLRDTRIEEWQKPIEIFVSAAKGQNGRRCISAKALWEHLGVTKETRRRSEAQAVATILRSLGFRAMTVRDEMGVARSGYVYEPDSI